jgi:hypothetical protein
MKYSLLLMGILFIAPQSAPANTPAYAHCGTYDSYILLYRSIQKFEELGKLHCGESVAIIGRDGDFTQVQTTDGRLGWVPTSDLSTTAPPPQAVYTFGWTDTRKPEPKPEQPVSQTPEPAPVRKSIQTLAQTTLEAPVATPAQTTLEAPVPTPAQTTLDAPVATPEQTVVEVPVPTATPTIVQPTVEPTVQTAEQPDERPVVARASESAPLLTNVNIMKMQGARMSPDTIIARLNAARCDFDTSSAALHRLKLSGVSDRIILAMMHAPAAFPMLTPDGAPSIEVRIPNQTPVQVAVSSDVSPDNLQEGSVVEMTVVEPVTLSGVTVIPRGAEARARIMAVRRSSMGSSGQVVWFMQDITAATGDRVPASFAGVQDAKAAIGKFAGYPFFLSEYRKGAPAIAASSDHYTSLVDGDIRLRIPRSTNVEQSVAKVQAQPQPVEQAVPAATAAPVFPVIVQTPDPQAAVKP